MELTSIKMVLWSDPYKMLDGKVGFQWTLAIYVISVLIIGSLILLGMIIYEREGGDPQKRGLKNQV